jgi:hypothetical protein
MTPYCPYCDREFQSLGIATHRAWCRERQTRGGSPPEERRYDLGHACIANASMLERIVCLGEGLVARRWRVTQGSRACEFYEFIPKLSHAGGRVIHVDDLDNEDGLCFRSLLAAVRYWVFVIQPREALSQVEA